MCCILCATNANDIVVIQSLSSTIQYTFSNLSLYMFYCTVIFVASTFIIVCHSSCKESRRCRPIFRRLATLYEFEHLL